MTGAEPLLEARDVVKRFPVRSGLFGAKNYIVALDGVSLGIARGESVGLAGESGCGKSTLASILLGLDAPDSGKVILAGRSVSAYDPKHRAQMIQPVFQDPYSSLNPKYTIAEIVGQGLRIRGGLSRSERRARVLEFCDLVGLTRQQTTRYPYELSGGQRQRVAIARTLVLRPQLVICDEPTSALDVSVQAQILTLLQELQAELSLSYLFISHDLPVIRYLCSRVIVMNAGRIVEKGTVPEIFEHPSHDYTRRLLSSVLPVRRALSSTMSVQSETGLP